MKQTVHTMSGRNFYRAIALSIVLSAVVVVIAAGLGRAVRNLESALTGKPDIAVYLLLPDEGIRHVTLLRSEERRRDYLVETKEGPKLLVLEMPEKEWQVKTLEPLRDGDANAR